MRKILMAALVVIVSGCAGMQPISEADLTFNAVFEVQDAPRDKIFTATNIWIAENFRSAKSVIEYENKEEGTLIGNGVIPYPCSGLDCVVKANWSVPFTMRVDMKDQKFRLTFSNIRLSWPPSYSPTLGAQSGHDGPVSLQGDLDAIKPKLLGFGDELIASIRKNGSTKNW
tara:strand:- start:5060 stop:5572 length:513 start_codon:yes stop_codon:yes gene_type:complete